MLETSIHITDTNTARSCIAKPTNIPQNCMYCMYFIEGHSLSHTLALAWPLTLVHTCTHTPFC